MSKEWSRFIPVEGGFNVRDLGLYKAGHGSAVRTGLVYRSASLAALTDADLILFSRLGIRTVVDLRSTAERQHRPSQLKVPTWSRDYDSSDADLVRALRDPTTTADVARDYMIATYRNLLDEQAASFAEILRRIARGELPILFHCAAGKDRTGVAAALLLSLLGVSRSVIDEDYLQTRATVDRAIGDARTALAQVGIGDLDDAVLRPILDVDVDYLDAMFKSLEACFGTVEIYAYRQLGLTSGDLAAIRSRLLEAQ